MDKQLLVFLISSVFFFVEPICAQRADSLRVYKKPVVQPLDTVNPGVYPPSWWTGMEYDTVELMFHAKKIKTSNLIVEPEGLQILSDDTTENANYRFIRCHIPADFSSRVYHFTFENGNGTSVTLDFEVLGPKKHRPRSIDGGDVMYLIMPDRFANGNPKNDIVAGMKEVTIDRSDVFKRHGGDLSGLISRMDYLQDLGVSAIWLNPVLENDQFLTSYHGYAITDHYKIDPRFGSNKDYLKWTNECRSRGIKVVKDMILNHCGSEHFLIRDLPSKEWVHAFDEYTKCNFRTPVLMDPYAAKTDIDRFQRGWFDVHMPDLNQQHPRVSTFLIQHALWWIEHAGIDAYRVDTYPYPYLDFTNSWNEAILRDYPSFSIFGETWVNAPAIQAYFSEKNHSFPAGSNAPALTDFQTHFALLSALTEPPTWTSGVSQLYLTLAQDFIYNAPEKHVVFLDNHDKNRIWSTLEQDMDRWKMGMTLLMTIRGIPCIYYGSEILLEGVGGMYGEQGRVSFPGGWPSDSRSAFQPDERTHLEQEAFTFLQYLINLRRNYPALSHGKLTQFIPQEGLYVYGRTGENQQFIILVNTSDRPKRIDPDQYQEVWDTPSPAFDHISKSRVDRGVYFLDPGSTQLLQIEKASSAG